MSKNSAYHRPNYNPPTVQRRQRQKSLSPSPLKMSTAKTKLGHLILKQEYPTTQAKRGRENQVQYNEHIPKSLYHQRTNKKSPYQNHLQPSSYVNLYEGSINSNKNQLAKQQNLYLMQQNKQLNQLLTQRSKIISSLQMKLQHQIQQQVLTLEQIERQKNKFLTEFHARDDQQRIQIQRLLIQLEHSHRRTNDIQNIAANQMETIKASFSQQNRYLIDQVISKNETDLRQKQHHIRQLTEDIDQLTTQMRTQRQSQKALQQHLGTQVSKLLQQLQLVNHQKRLELSEQKVAFQNIIATINRQKQQQVSNTIFNYQVQMKKLKNLYNQKLLEQNNLQMEIQSDKLQHSNKLQQLLQKETMLKYQNHQIQMFYQQANKEQVQKEKKITHNQAQMYVRAHQLIRDQYQEQIQNLVKVNRQKSIEIENLYISIQKLRQQSKEQNQRIQRLNSQLRQRMTELIRQNQDETQMLKIKMGELRHADLHSLKECYENQITGKTQQIMDLEKMLGQNRDKVHKQLEQRLVQKKRYEYAIDQLRIKNGELQLLIASMGEQHKENLQSMGSQMQMTSMTLIRQSTQKQSYSQQAQVQKKKLQQIITSKDCQIAELNSKTLLLKSHHSQQISQASTNLQLLTDKNQQLNSEIRRERQFYQKEMQKKQQAKKQTKDFYEQEIQNQKQAYAEELSQTTQKLMNDNKDLTVTVQHLTLLEKQLRAEMGIHAEHHQQANVQTHVHYSQQKSRLQYAKQTLEINLKAYYQKRLNEVQEQLMITKQQVAQKCQDLRSTSQKNHKLQKKIQKIMQSQQKMKALEQKVMALGQQNNFVKNLSDMAATKSRRRAV